MDISPLNKLLLAALLLFSLTGCASDCPNRMPYNFIVTNWQGTPVKTVSIIRYKQDSNLRIIEKKFLPESIIFSSQELTNKKTNIVIHLELSVWEHQPLTSDYKIIINDKFEFRITQMTSSNKMNLGCPLATYSVNDHKMDGEKDVYLDQTLAESVKQQ